jgi:hypothetical protein
MKLHLGCGQDYWLGYVNIDVDPKANSDLQMNCMDIELRMSALSDYGVVKPVIIDEIVMIHVINYLTLWEARDFFEMAYRVLEPGGVFIVETVDANKCVNMLQKYSCDSEYLEGIRGLVGFGIDHLIERRNYEPHKFIWTYRHMCAELTLAGFDNVACMPPVYHNPQRDMRVEGWKKR